MIDSDTRLLRAAECAYFVRVRGMSSAETAGVVGLSIEKVEELLVEDRHPPPFVPLPDEIRQHAAAIRAANPRTLPPRTFRSVPAIFSRVVSGKGVNDDDAEQDAA